MKKRITILIIANIAVLATIFKIAYPETSPWSLVTVLAVAGLVLAFIENAFYEFYSKNKIKGKNNRD